MPGPGSARDRPERGTFRDAATAGTLTAGLASVRLREGLDAWRRHIARRQSAAAARRWSLIALGAALGGVAIGRLDGSVLVTAVAATALPLGAGVVSVVLRRRVSAADAARQLDAAYGFDEQVATALCSTEAGTTVSGGATDHDRLVVELIKRAAELVAGTGSAAESRPAPAYGEWAAMAVTAAAVAAVAAVPGPHPATLATASGGPGRTGPVTSATAPRPAHAGGAIPGKAGAAGSRVTPGHRTAPTARRAADGGVAAGTRPAASATGSKPASASGTEPASATGTEPPSATGTEPPSAAGTPTAASGASTSPANAGGQTPSAGTGAPVSPGAAGAGGGRSTATPTASPGQRGPARPAPGQSQTAQSPATQSPATHAPATQPPATQAPATQSPATQSPAAQSPATQSPTTRAAVTQHSGPGSTAQHTAGSRGTAAGTRGHSAGDAAGTQRGSDRSARPAQPLPSAGNNVLLIVLPGGDGIMSGPSGQAPPGQPAGDGGSATATPGATAQGNSAEYVPPDQNEVPFPDQSMLGRYF